MAFVPSTTTTLDDICGLVIAEVRYNVSNLSDLRQAVTIKQLGQGEKYASFPIIAKLHAYDLAQGESDLDYVKAVSSDKVDLTPTEKGCPVFISDALMKGSTTDIVKHVGILATSAIQSRINQDIFGLFTGISDHVIGTSNVNISEDNILFGRASINSAGRISTDPINCVIPAPHVERDFLKLYASSTNNTVEAFRNAAMAGQLPNPFGVNFYLMNDLVAGTTTGLADAADIDCGMFAKSAIGYVEGWDIRIEAERKQDLRGYLFHTTVSYAVGIVNPALVYKFTVDNKD
jgi:hypothetical protein